MYIALCVVLCTSKETLAPFSHNHLCTREVTSAPCVTVFINYLPELEVFDLSYLGYLGMEVFVPQVLKWGFWTVADHLYFRKAIRYHGLTGQTSLHIENQYQKPSCRGPEADHHDHASNPGEGTEQPRGYSAAVRLGRDFTPQNAPKDKQVQVPQDPPQP